MTRLTVRPATKDDLSAIDALLARSYPALLKRDYPPSVLVTALPLISRAQPALVTSGSYYVVEEAESGEVLGAGGWTRAAPGGGRATSGLGHIRHVATAPDRVRSGVGRHLMTHIAEQAQQAGMTRLEALSTLTAVPFYAAMGFEVVEKTIVALRPGIDFPAVRMLRTL